MPYIDASTLLLDPMIAGEPFTVLRRQQTIDAFGMAQLQTPRLNAVGSIGPVSPDQLSRLPDQAHQAKTLNVVTTTRLYGQAKSPDGAMYLPDLLLWKGDYFVVQALDDYTQYGAGMVQAICTSIDYTEAAPAMPTAAFSRGVSAAFAFPLRASAALNVSGGTAMPAAGFPLAPSPVTLSAYTANLLVDWATGNANMPAAPSVYLAPFYGDPSASGRELTGTVVTARTHLTGMALSTGGARSSANSLALVFSAAALTAGTCTYLAAYDAASAGNLLWYKPILPANILAGNVLQILAGALVIQSGADLSGYAGDYFVNWLTGSASFPATTPRYLALYNGDPAGAGVEDTSTLIGARPQLSISAASGANAANVAPLALGPTKGAAALSYLAVFDALTGGNIICSRANGGGVLSIPAGSPLTALAGGLSFRGMGA
jgi:hypothetical protein